MDRSVLPDSLQLCDGFTSKLGSSLFPVSTDSPGEFKITTHGMTLFLRCWDAKKAKVAKQLSGFATFIRFIRFFRRSFTSRTTSPKVYRRCLCLASAAPGQFSAVGLGPGICAPRFCDV